MRRLRWAVAAAAALLACAAAAIGGEDIAGGKGETVWKIDSHSLTLFTYRAAGYSREDSPLILVFHGYSRNAETYRNYAVTLADECGALVVAPHFDEQQFPGRMYNHGNVMAEGKVLPREHWTFSVVPKLIEAIRKVEQRPEMPYYLLGHSGGGQFVERLVAFVDLEPIRAVAANPGSHLFAGMELPYPYGFDRLPERLSNGNVLKGYLAAPLTIYLGAADTDSDDPLLDKNAAAQSQGAHRLERGRHCFETAQQLAAERGWPFNWRLVEAAGIGHSAAGMFKHAQCRAALLGGDRQ